MTWESLDWQPADSASLDSGAAILPIWPMLRSAIAEAVSADAMCPVTCGELLVGHIDAGQALTPLAPSSSFELLGTDRRGSWAAFEPTKGDRLGGKVYAPERIQELVLEALDSAFEALVGEGLSLGPAIELPEPDSSLLLLRLPMTSVDNEDLVLISAYEAAVGGELAAHVAALQALAAEQPVEPAAPPAPVQKQPTEHKSPAIPRATPTLPPPPSGRGSNGSAGQAAAGPAAPAANVRIAELPELSGSSTGGATYNIDLLLGVNLQVAVEIGRTTLPIRDVLGLTPGSIVELDKLAGEKVDVLVNGRPIAQGEVVVVDENFGVRITDVVSRQQRLAPVAGRA